MNDMLIKPFDEQKENEIQSTISINNTFGERKKKV